MEECPLKYRRFVLGEELLRGKGMPPEPAVREEMVLKCQMYWAQIQIRILAETVYFGMLKRDRRHHGLHQRITTVVSLQQELIGLETNAKEQPSNNDIENY